MRTSKDFVLGAIMGGRLCVAVGEGTWRIDRREDARSAHEGSGGCSGGRGTAVKVLDRGGDALRRADEFLQDTKGQVSEALRAGQEAIRPAPAARKA